MESKTPLEEKLHTPLTYASPEILFYDSITPASDIWALATFMHKILSGGYVVFASDNCLKKQVLARMVIVLGKKLPDRYWNMWEERAEYFDDDGKWSGDPTWIRQNFLHIPRDRMAGDELRLIEEVFRKMVSFEPKDRISAKEVVRLLPEEWLQRNPGTA